MAARDMNSDKECWGFGTFEGHPKYATAYWVGKRVDSEDEVMSTIKDICFLPTENVRLIKGKVEDSIPTVKNEIDQIAVLRIDVDWYIPTKAVLDELYELVDPGGFIIFDDYGAKQGCKEAVNEFFRNRNEAHIIDQLVDSRIDYACAELQKLN